MHLWRICREPFADLSGEGARLHGGRWNSPGHPVVYTAESAALAVLEVRVHLDLTYDLLPRDYVLMDIDGDDLSVEDAPASPIDTVLFGDEWIASGRSCLLRVRSVIVQEATNVLINPRHSDIARVRVASMRSFAFDERLWNP